jgi:hypothetical protein
MGDQSRPQRPDPGGVDTVIIREQNLHGHLPSSAPPISLASDPLGGRSVTPQPEGIALVTPPEPAIDPFACHDVTVDA